MNAVRKKPRNHDEDQLQKAVVLWLATQENLGRLTYFAIPNNPRSARDGARLKQMGLRAGTPDLCIMAKDHVPLFIELKAKRGRVSDAQWLAASRLSENGSCVAHAKSLEEVQVTVAVWLATKIEARAA